MKRLTAAIVLAGSVGLGIGPRVYAAGARALPVAQSAAAADHMEQRFDDVERWAKVFDDPSRDAWQEPARVVDALQLSRGQTVADIGAGTGYFTVALAKSPASPRVYAVDVEPAMVEYVRQRAAKEGLTNVRAVQASAQRANLPFPVDLVLLVDTYHHISNRVGYFTTLRLRMKPTARLAVIDHRPGAPGGPPEAVRVTPEQVSTELAKAGFVLESQHDFLSRQHFLVFRMNP
ncbi:MAG: methyltransferase domain-containing protein [Vicinamibacterales bacterium]